MKRILLLTVVALAFGVLAPTSHADFRMTMSDGSNPTITVIDDVQNDTIAGLGKMAYSASLGAWSVVISTGLSKDVVGGALNPVLHLDTICVTSTSSGTLTIKVMDTGFYAAPTWTSTTLKSEFGGILGGGSASTATLDQILDVGNGGIKNDQFGSLPGTLSVSLAASVGSFGAEGIDMGPLVSGPFSITEILTVYHAGKGSSSFNAESTVVPVPAALLLGLLGLGAAGVKLRRFA